MSICNFSDLQARLFFQNCTGILYENIIKMKFPVSDNPEPLPDSFNFEEENALRYVGGYVISILKKRHQSDKEIIAGLNHLTNKNPVSMLSAEWVQEVNRGWLTIITDQAQDVFMSIETCIKSKLRVNSAHKMDEETRHNYKVSCSVIVMSSLIGA